jgi:serine/threonine protein phosphatase PrpC
MSIMGVCDGHGESGHHVSGLVSKTLPGIIRETYGHFVGRVVDLWPTVLIESYKQVVTDLSRQSFDSTYSGSTSVTVVYAGGSLICANVGDSRAVLGRRTGASFTAVALSRDQKPDVEEEKQRILDFGGRVEAINIDGEDIGPLRVWLQSEDAPGLAMTRALGDTIASRCGVISIPEVIITPLSPEDAFVILASDGIWEFISSQEAVDMAGSYLKDGRLEDCCQALLAEATLRWRREEDCIDDIIVLVAELNSCR